MSTYQQPEDQSNFPLWPWDEKVIDAAEHNQSLRNLQRFATEVDVNQLCTLEDVSAVTSLVGHDLRILILVHGKQVEKTIGERLVSESGEPVSHIERDYIYIGSYNEHQFVIMTHEGQCWISKRCVVGMQRYQREELSIRLPTDRDIAIGNIPNVEVYSLYMLDMRNANKKEYYPVEEPENAELQQKFTALLKETIEDIVSLFSYK